MKPETKIVKRAAKKWATYRPNPPSYCEFYQSLVDLYDILSQSEYSIPDDKYHHITRAAELIDRGASYVAKS